MKKFSIVFGTRPELIKLVSLIKAFEQIPNVELNVCFTGQHKEMVLPLIDFFQIKIHSSLEIMQPNQTLASLSSRAVKEIEKYFLQVQPEAVFVQGDTTTAMCAATAAFYNKIKVFHIEAGLRTNDLYSPFPEEFNRQVISKIATLHFAPTEKSKQNLLREGVDSKCIFVTGNTVIDALLYTKHEIEKNPQLYQTHNEWENEGKPFILITGHRRENFGNGFENICSAIKELAEKYPSHNFVYPVHLNPNVQKPVHRTLQGLPNVFLVSPLNYIHFTSLMAKSFFILTDSGGVQEEAPSLGKPVLIMRDTTERDEVITVGAAKLVGTKKEEIISAVTSLFENKELYHRMSNVSNPFGDGKAADKILELTLEYFK